MRIIGAGGLAWLRYRLDVAGVVGPNPTRPIEFIFLIYCFFGKLF
jgi:hypothetical protein